MLWTAQFINSGLLSLSVLEEEKSKLKEVTEMFFVLTH